MRMTGAVVGAHFQMAWEFCAPHGSLYTPARVGSNAVAQKCRFVLPVTSQPCPLYDKRCAINAGWAWSLTRRNSRPQSVPDLERSADHRPGLCFDSGSRNHHLLRAARLWAERANKGGPTDCCRGSLCESSPAGRSLSARSFPPPASGTAGCVRHRVGVSPTRRLRWRGAWTRARKWQLDPRDVV